MKFLLIAFSLLVAAPTDSTKLTLSKAEQIISRPLLKPVDSFRPGPAKSVIDTLDTASPFMKIILYSDNTWEYRKDGDEIAGSEVFNEHWNNVNADPYKIALDTGAYEVIALDLMATAPSAYGYLAPFAAAFSGNAIQ